MAGLALVVGLLVLAWSTVQLTSRGEAELALQQTLAPLTEIDRLLQRDYPTLVQTAREGESASVIIQGYPLGVAIPSRELATMTAVELRARVLALSASRVYQDGLDAFQREPGGRGGVFSPRGVFSLTAGQLTDRSHTIAIIAAVVLVLFLLPMLAVVLAQGNSRAQAQRLGAGIFAAGVGLALAVVIGRIVLRAAAGTGDPFDGALLDAGLDIAWLPARNAVIVAALGALIVAGTLAYQAAERRWASGSMRARNAVDAFDGPVPGASPRTARSPRR